MVTYLFSIKRSLRSFLLLYSFCLIMASAILFGINHLRVWCCPLSVCLLGSVPSPSADSVWLMYDSCWRWFLLTYGLQWTEAPTEPRLLLICGLYWLMAHVNSGFLQIQSSSWSMASVDPFLLMIHGSFWTMVPANPWQLLTHDSWTLTPVDPYLLLTYVFWWNIAPVKPCLLVTHRL